MSVEKINGPNGFIDKELRKVSSKAKTEGSSSRIGKGPKTSAAPKGPEAEETRVDSTFPGDLDTDSVEISFSNPDVVDKIQALVDQVKKGKDAVSQRIEEARMQLLERAYDNAEEMQKTAEAILRGEDIESLNV